MALNSKVGSFTLNTTTGNQAITGIGFQPKAIIFFGNRRTSDGSDARADWGFGMATSSTARGCIMQTAEDNVSAATALQADRMVSDVACYELIDKDQNYLVSVDFVSNDSDGFTVNIVNATAAAAYVVNYIALGGSDLTNAKVQHFTSPTATGNQTISGVGFQPDSVFLLGNPTATALPAYSTGAHGIMGFASSSTARGSIGWEDQDAINPTITSRTQRTDKVFHWTLSGSTFLSADLSSFNSDGMVLNWTTVQATGRRMIGLFLKGGQFKVGSASQKTSTGTNATTGVGFTPTGLVLASFNNIATTSVVDNIRNSFGAASGTTARGAAWMGSSDNVATRVADSNLDRTKVIKMMTEGTPTTEAAADLSSFDSDGFTLDWTTADATAREILYFAFGSPAVSAQLRRGYLSLLGVS